MKITPLILLALLVATQTLAQTAGGQDILIADTEVRFPNEILDVDTTVDGTLFAISHGDSSKSFLNVYRSNNGGSTWHVWDQIQSLHTDGRVHEASLAISETSPGSVLIAWVDQRLSSAGSWVRVSRASVADEVPTWSHSLVYFIFNLDVQEPSIDAISGTVFSTRVVVAFRSGPDILYANSADTGDTFSTPIVIASDTPDVIHQGFQVAADNGGVTHLGWTSYVSTGGLTLVHYRRALFSGELLANWEATRSFLSFGEYGDFGVTIAANHSVGGMGVIMAMGGSLFDDPPTYVFQSTDSGENWGLTGTLDEVSSPDATYGAAGPILGAAIWGSLPQDTGWALLTPGDGQWNQDLLVSINTNVTQWHPGPAVVADPTRGGQALVVGLKKQYHEDTYSLFFDAAWRGNEGFGVPDPAGFSRTTPGYIPILTLTADVTDDSYEEVIVVFDEPDGDRSLRCLDHQTGDWILSELDVSPVSGVALANLDDEPGLEIFCVRASDARLQGLDADGFPVPRFPMVLGLGDGPYFLSAGPMISEDVDWLVVAEDRTIHVLGEDGYAPPGFPWTAPEAGGVVYGRVAIGDVDGDGLGEMVIPMTERTVVLGHDGQVEAVFGEGLAAAGNPSLADFDDDGDLEIVIPRSDGTIDLVHHDGTPAGNSWPYDTGIPGFTSQVALTDLAGDDRRDLIFMDATHGLRVVTPAGNVVLNLDMDVPLGSPVIEPVVARVGPGAGQRAVIVGGVDGRLRVRTLDGMQDGWPRDMGGEIHAPVAVADVDSDGKVEMVVATTEDIWILDMGVSGPFASEIWPMSGADPRRLGSVGSGPVSNLSATPLVPESATMLHGAAPNPFNPATSIRFRLEEDTATVSLRVYDVAGRLIKTLHQGSLPAGDQEIIWRGDDSRGRAVASGVYHARLQAGAQVLTRSMVLAR